MSSRRTYRVTLAISVQIDDEPLKEVERLIQEHVYEMYYKMERNDIRILLQHQLHVEESK